MVCSNAYEKKNNSLHSVASDAASASRVNTRSVRALHSFPSLPLALTDTSGKGYRNVLTLLCHSVFTVCLCCVVLSAFKAE